MSDTMTQIELSPAEIDKLPAGLRKKIEKAFGPVYEANGNWILVGATSAATANVIGDAIQRLEKVLATYATARQERNIERLLEMFAEDQPHADVDVELELENAEMRAEYLAETKLLTAQQVRALSGLTPRNQSEPASRWKREGKIFAVRKGAIDLYPAFQFSEDKPKTAIKEILKALPDDLSPWQIAFWFESGNGWLDGEAPQDCLHQAKDVVAAAGQLANPAIG